MLDHLAEVLFIIRLTKKEREVTSWGTWAPLCVTTTNELGCIAIGQIEKLKLREGPPLPRVMQLVRD